MRRVIVVAALALLTACSSTAVIVGATSGPSTASAHAAVPTTTTATASTPAPVAVVVPPAPAAAPAHKLPAPPFMIGISPTSAAAVAPFIAATGTTPDTMALYQDWADNSMFDADSAKVAAASGVKNIFITWESWAPGCNCVNQPAFTDRGIAAGQHDAYINAYAASVKAYGKPVTIRLDHEQNGNWYPWGVGVNGNSAADYIAMWRHVHDLFAAAGVTNVTWLWGPNTTWSGNPVSLGSTYPGDAYVDEVGFSGYNWGPGGASGWMTFNQLYSYSLDQLHRIAPSKPVIIAEIGCVSKGGSRAAWMTDMFTQIKARPYITGLIWFEQAQPNFDWPIENDPSAIAAWKNGIASLQ